MSFWPHHLNLYKALITLGVRSTPNPKQIAEIKRKMESNPELPINSLKMKLDPESIQDVVIYNSIMNEGGYEPASAKLVSDVLKDGMCFMDIGANSGYYTVLAASCLKSTGSIVAIEPQTNAYERLKYNVQLNHIDNATLLHNAAYSEITEVNIGLPVWGDAEASIDYPNSTKYERVGTVTVDSVCKEPDVIKMDVEGYELEVLRGATSALKTVKHIIFEQNLRRLVERRMRPNSVIDYIKKQGFEIYDIDSGKKINDYRDASAISSNLHATR